MILQNSNVISVISTKGGVGKTTLSANLAGYLHNLGFSVLMIDADPQPSLSSYYPINNKANGGLVEVLNNPKKVNDYISQTSHGDLIYSNDNQNNLQNYLRDYPDGQFRLAQAIKYIEKLYDIIIIDTQGAKGVLQNAAVLAANQLLSPVLPEMTTIREFERGTLDMFNNLQTLKDMGIDIADIVNAIVYRMDRTKNASRYKQILINTQSSQQYPYQVLQTEIPDSVVYDEATGQQIPVTEFAKSNKKQQQKAQKSISAIKKLTEELKLQGKYNEKY